ncbi:hypothetical protein [Ulvibacter antarcticus]|uniref:Calcium-binding protein n=1 Tax=Ulvibacter antarcticus TaxID=442714 RepID=A0A3L9ZC08_9FLAO|nr:hypothetical protein [Ulvibacter antarcticus]RMA64152.1 hypothetical protein BXY75_1019 [Ulvibacter antarcticus]
MKKLLWLLCALIAFSACDDGDIIVTSFNFDDINLEVCNTEDTYVFFKINNDALESLSVQLNLPQTIFYENGTTEYNFDGTTNFANYRIYTASLTSSYFCSSVPPTDPEIVINYLGNSGTASLTIEATLSDSDNLPTIFDSNGNISDEINVEGTADNDEDGIPNYYDFDDDGDNVLTSAELGLDPTNPQDTDGDGIPDYLDPDDDGDGVLTRNEDLNGDRNPTNDKTDGLTANYLNGDVAITNVVDAYREHTYSYTSNANLIITNLVLTGSNEQITQQSINLGEKTSVSTGTINVTPQF